MKKTTRTKKPARQTTPASGGLDRTKPGLVYLQFPASMSFADMARAVNIVRDFERKRRGLPV